MDPTATRTRRICNLPLLLQVQKLSKEEEEATTGTEQQRHWYYSKRNNLSTLSRRFWTKKN